MLGRYGEAMTIRSFARGLIHGVTWKNPFVNVVVHSADPVDFIVRAVSGRRSLPPYSIRVRSNGVRQDIGGKGFILVGRQIVNLLRAQAGLKPDSRVLEVGCGCGRNALALAYYLDSGKYQGMDIERVALEAAKKNRRLTEKQFTFEFLDVRNDAYNPEGRYPATEYVLPYADKSFDVVFLISVLTHMLTEEVKNYAKEISRVLCPGGNCFLTAYLLDRDMNEKFPFKSQEHSFADESMPGIAVAYRSEFLCSTFDAQGMSLQTGPLWGSVHGAESRTSLDQDVLVFTKRG